jgi:rfaE bifunctional protein kinase chain/domain
MMTTAEILARFPAMSALVIGDICLDRWCTYDATLAEESRETGIPRVAVVATETTPGAGGTVANNLAALGVGRVSVVGAVGRDGFGFELKEALRKRNIDPDLLVESPALPTFTYTKLLNLWTGAEDQPRIDFVNTQPLAAELEDRIIDRLAGAVRRGVDAVLISDQAETSSGGVVTPRVRAAICDLAGRFPRTVFWTDSRLRAELFRGVIVKPNEREAEQACRRAFGLLDLDRLRALIGDCPLIVTHGGDGAEIFEAAGRTWVATRKVAKPVDICGAGDSFSAGAALAMAVTGSAADAVRMGNLVASVTIMKKGTGTATPQEVLEAEARP